MAEEKQQGEEVVQEPLKKEKKSLGVSLPLMIGAAAGILVIIVLGVILGVFFASKFMGVQHAGGEGEKGKTEKTAKSNIAEEDEGDYLSKLKDIAIMETGRITTNPKGSSSVFVVVNFGFEFKKMDNDNKELKTLVNEGAVNMEHPVIKKMMARIRSTLNKMIASYTKEELLEKRHEIPELVKKELRPIFRDYELLLVNVTIQEFIIQE